MSSPQPDGVPHLVLVHDAGRGPGTSRRSVPADERPDALVFHLTPSWRRRRRLRRLVGRVRRARRGTGGDRAAAATDAPAGAGTRQHGRP